MKLNHAQIVKDYNKLIKMYAVPEDMTGGLVVEEVLMEAILKGTKNACAKAILTIFEYGFQYSNNEVYRYESGGNYKEVSIYECEFVKYISETYLR